MKVSRRKGFEPITITLETEDEALQMWHLLNMADSDMDYTHGYKKPTVCNTFAMWQALDDKFRPEETK